MPWPYCGGESRVQIPISNNKLYGLYGAIKAVSQSECADITMMIIKVITVVNDETTVTFREVAYLSKRSKNWVFSVSGSHVSLKLVNEWCVATHLKSKVSLIYSTTLQELIFWLKLLMHIRIVSIDCAQTLCQLNVSFDFNKFIWLSQNRVW